MFNFLNNSLAFYYAAEDDVFIVQPRARDESDEELTSVRVGTCIGHTEQERLFMFKLEVFIGEFLPVDGTSSGSIEVSKIPSLGHELRNDAMENGVGEAKAFLSSDQSSEVFGSFGHHIFKQFKNNFVRFTVKGHVEKDLRVFIGLSDHFLRGICVFVLNFLFAG